MLEIDGSHGEGGGQIVRTALAMSMITGESIKIDEIRANRENPGLSHQHLMAIKAAAEIGHAETEGAKKGSDTIIFEPGEIEGGRYSFDIGTAGSITLLLQALIPPALKAEEEFTIKVRGGTDVKWSPPYDYFDKVFLPFLRKMDGNISSELIKRGHYPKGGGKIKLDVEPGKLTDLELEEKIEKIKGKAFVTDLPDHIAERMKKEALKEFMEFETNIDIETYSSASPGTGIVLWTTGGKRLGMGVLGEKGRPAEKVGEEAATDLRKDIEAEVSLDPNAADQLIPYLAMIDTNGTLTVRKRTGHLETNIWLVNRFPGMNVELKDEEKSVQIKY
ncbi:MAG: RNA 3'-terminal phosphate cyclase [Candidatus Thermoplasmatota archaeon]|nr:RNA 3'-terminal phosphate cyclase [Candidatus Thermoplasmatota archaeon]